MKRKPKALALLSGGLDSLLAAKLIMIESVKVEGVHFINPFSADPDSFLDEFSDETGIRIHKIPLGRDFLNLIINPRHGYGSHMNPCIDCRIFALKKAKKLMEKIGADFIVTGEVLDERPFSQRMEALLMIEKEAGLEGKILRPLSAKLLPITEPEKIGFVNRERLLAIRGRRRVVQIELARRLGIKRYASPSGGCLLTDPRFSERLRDYLKYRRRLRLIDVELLKIGRHLRLGKTKIIVGRNREENHRLLSIAKNEGLLHMEVIGYPGPITVVVGRCNKMIIQKAIGITIRYSDAPSHEQVDVKITKKDKVEIMRGQALDDQEIRKYII
ncbi:MAG: tRNA 4-thiouridine(8) synthase ThiI [Nitrososphaerota archaeon]|nr:tRNA 4-thiouridine(8) synthase ThiI [Candidatus Bathyarchaeota archaeon]MDW8048411.1 tRNA 4-thiouridine(8) synthase ThiI [Nitrososphaerota archaeon]